MTRCESGDVILLRFPFSDLSTAKKRPAVVISPAAFSERHGDVVILALTSVAQNDRELRLRRWRVAGLLKPTWIKPVLATLALDLVEQRLGALSDDDWRSVDAVLKKMIATGRAC